jgi:site-specific DNA recombinase
MASQEIAALYARTSKEINDAYSVDSQIIAGQSFAETNQLVIPEGYAFREDFTGKALNRPELDKLMKLVREKKVTSVIIYAVDRLARKIGVADMLLDEFLENGVNLWIMSWNTYVKSTPEDRLRFNFEATFSDFERRKIAERTTRGKKDKVRQGIYLGTGKPPYGYRKVGEKKQIRVEIIEEQAKVIRQIFQWYAVERIAVAEILRRLNGTPTPSEAEGVRNFPHKRRPPGDWANATLYLILKTTAYAGSMKNFGSKVDVPAILEPGILNWRKSGSPSDVSSLFAIRQISTLWFAASSASSATIRFKPIHTVETAR